MKTIDTNVLTRLFVADDPTQTASAEALVRSSFSEGVFVPQVVLIEASWVLRSSYKRERSFIASSIENVCTSEPFVVEDSEQVLRALKLYLAGSSDLADYLILTKADESGALPLFTFDKKLAHTEHVTLLS